MDKQQGTRRRRRRDDEEEKVGRRGRATRKGANSMDEFAMNELSICVTPAQKHAGIALMKSADTSNEELNSSDEGTNTVDGVDGSYNKKEKVEMTEKVDKAATQDTVAKTDFEALQAELTVAKAVAEMSDEQKTLYKSLSDEDKTDFIAKSDEKRTEMIEMAKSADPVVYTSAEGEVFRKSDDSRIVAMAKELDKTTRESAAAIAKAEMMSFEKQAEDELSHLPGTATEKAMVLKAMSAMTDETREIANRMFKANNGTMKNAFGKSGTGQEPALNDNEGGADAELNKMAKEYADKHNVSFSKAYTACLSTPEGRKLYNEHKES